MQTWETVAGYNSDILGAKFRWVPAEDYLRYTTGDNYMMRCALFCDRAYDRRIDASKVLKVTGLTSSDFLNIRQGIIRELSVLSERPELVERMGSDAHREVSRRMDEYLSK